MKSYLVGEDLWNVVNESNTSPPADGLENSSAYKKWKHINAKAEFILKRTISSGLFDHITKYKSAYKIWKTLDQLFKKKNKARLQILENELANTTQDKAIAEAQMRRIVICGLKSEYIPFVMSIQGWAQQSSLEKFENLLSSHELLAKQLAGVFVKDGEGNALIADKRNFKENARDTRHSRSLGGSSSLGKKEEPSNYYGKKPLRCYRCGEVRHIKRYCRAKESNMAQKVAEEEEEWGKCLVAEARAIDVMISINLERD